jgi:hypothetical protein
MPNNQYFGGIHSVSSCLNSYYNAKQSIFSVASELISFELLPQIWVHGMGNGLAFHFMASN